ncbi:MAG TPA: sugar phosphate isomerase/epimerase family protein [Planctomycetota bacterium]|nr:sugar phosphate isomerase/epimerase family protein [Planctomycetota bacterium]
MSGRIGVCSWSLRAGTPKFLAERLKKAGLDAVQLAIDPIRKGHWSIDDTVEVLDEAGIAICSGMMAMRGEDYSTLESIRKTGGVRPDEHWKANLDAAHGNAEMMRGLNIDLVTLHAGFLPHDREDPEWSKMIDRLCELMECFVEEGARVGFETGQETAETLLAVLEEIDHPNVGVNFDPANMILYDVGDPVEALAALAPHVFQIHIKDAVRTEEPGTWGQEVPVGTGQVDWDAFFRVLAEKEIDCDLMIEREAGEKRIEDVCTARELLERVLC